MSYPKTIIAIGGGEIKNKTTLAIDRYIADTVSARVGDKRPVALFIGTASHDFMPYFNSFRKTYTSLLGFKADVALTVFKTTEKTRLEEKFQNADLIYVGGGDTGFLLESWRQTGLFGFIEKAYDDGKVIAGLSAGAVCWFEEMYTDSAMLCGNSGEYNFMPALGFIEGLACPHYNEREAEFDKAMQAHGGRAVAIEDNCAVVFENGELKRTVSSGGNAFFVEREGNITKKQKITL